MQIFIAFLLLFVLVAFIIYRVRDKFEKEEAGAFLVTIFIVIGGYLYYDNQQENYFPQQFQELYEKEKNIKIETLSYELLNNKNITSKNFFVYKFTYVIKKENKGYICVMPKVEIEKIGEGFVFKNFSQLKEECTVQ